jgi:hypothetical protein
MVPLGGDQHTHDGAVADDDRAFAGDEIYVSLTLVSARDGRVLWHIRDSVDVEANDPGQLAAFVQKYVALMPRSLGPGVPAAPGEVPVAPPPPPPPPAAPPPPPPPPPPG